MGNHGWVGYEVLYEGGDHRGQDQQGDQIDVGDQVRHELDDWQFVEAVLQRKREKHPEWGEDHKHKEKQNDLPAGPVEIPHPNIREVLLHRRMSYYILLLTLHQHV